MELWEEKVDEIYRLIKKVSDAYGGDDLEWLREYAKDIVSANYHSLDEALACFRDLERQLGKTLIT